ncbi:DNA primase [Streptomyces sp. NPDC005925]|uniref:DNA primase n=1 Tax=Streptomyces sp. NPDC005925 TaxID=3157172 RepID=UPI0033FD6C1E
MNRLALGLAAGAGYVRGRTKKAKTARVVGGLAAGWWTTLSSKALGGPVAGQPRQNPRLEEIRDQLRGYLSGVGRAVSAVVSDRRPGSLANGLRDRTARMRDRLAGVTPDTPGNPDTADEYDDDCETGKDENESAYEDDDAYAEDGSRR